MRKQSKKITETKEEEVAALGPPVALPSFGGARGRRPMVGSGPSGSALLLFPAPGGRTAARRLRRAGCPLEGAVPDPGPVRPDPASSVETAAASTARW